ncbi:MAG: glycosyl hydrolase, partial [Bacteroidota bacterium]
QFYRVAVDNSEPYYYVYGGTQDNSSWGAPARTVNSAGITNEDWFLIVGGDGYKPQVDPKDPNIVYGESQYGGLVRYDRKSGEAIYIQPQPEKGEEVRWNWDTPLLISPHSNTRLYFAANRLYRSNDRGNTWEAVSPDLSRQIDRNQLKVMDKLWSPETVAKNASTSLFGNIVSLTESPVKEDLLYVGTDDGLIQVSENGGKNWRKTEKFAEVPETTYVSDIYASQHNESIVYATFDNHKNNDFKPYVLKSDDKGVTWTSIAGNLPEEGAVYTITEDFVNPDLLFVGTEFGLYFTIDGGKKWIQLKNGLPPIAVRDLEIQKRETDLAIATFGRGIYILDDYSPLRLTSPETVEKDCYLYPIKDALMYVQDDSKNKYDMGENFYRAPNPPFGAIFTYYLKESPKSKKDIRKENEAKLEKDGKPIVYPTQKDLFIEDNEAGANLIFTITDETGFVVRRLTAPASKGIHRINWDLTYPSPYPVSTGTKPEAHSGMPVLPGKYKVSIAMNNNGVITQLCEPTEFTTKVLNNTTLPAKDRKALVDFQKQVANLQRTVSGTQSLLSDTKNKLKLIKNALLVTAGTAKELVESTDKLDVGLLELDLKLNGNKSLESRNENQTPSVSERAGYVVWGIWGISTDATDTQRKSYNIASEELEQILVKLKTIVEVDIKNLEKALDKLGAPWTPDRIPDWKHK